MDHEVSWVRFLGWNYKVKNMHKGQAVPMTSSLAWEPWYSVGRLVDVREALVHHAGPVWISVLHTPLETLWRTLRPTAFLRMFSFTVEASVKHNLEKLEVRAWIRTRPPKSEAEFLITKLPPPQPRNLTLHYHYTAEAW
ncbi:jg5699 [Pararge aegeria aegeria]|uniref:Jg5699 protein n=1 Tax=Pararge aegeria aegeria TaxID=348720 RepID=A0A8S4SBQ6_9NEOP|nr:jg5699 [Pararge aegeria aegeria]